MTDVSKLPPAQKALLRFSTILPTSKVKCPSAEPSKGTSSQRGAKGRHCLQEPVKTRAASSLSVYALEPETELREALPLSYITSFFHFLF